MGTDYHHSGPNSRPAQAEFDQDPSYSPPQGHYSSETGEWTGQLPNPDVSAFVLQQPSADIEYPNWPTLKQRLNWATGIIRLHQLSGPQGAVLRNIAEWDEGGTGYTATIKTLALDTGFSDRAVRNASNDLSDKGLIIAEGRAGQKKLFGLPMAIRRLAFQTPAGDAGVTHQNQTTTPAGDAGMYNHPSPTPAPDTGVMTNRETITPAGHAGVSHEQGPTQAGGTGVLDSIAKSPAEGAGVSYSIEREFREKENLNNNSLSSPQKSLKATDRDSPDEKTAIEQLVKKNWRLLNSSGWDHLGGALKHYQGFGLAYLEIDLEIKRERLEKQTLAARTCVHCQTVHETPEQVKPCGRCNDSICASATSSCRQNTCFRKQDKGGASREVRLTEAEFEALPRCPNCNHWHLTEADRDICNECRFSPGWFKDSDHEFMPGICPDTCLAKGKESNPSRSPTSENTEDN